METIYLCIVIFLLCLAVFDLFVGVSNDAVNFLQSAVGARVAAFRTVLIIASVGVVLGAVLSSGMMDVARHGIMMPDRYSFHEVMTLFLAVMVTDVIVLDVFNTLGMPTSTTVSLVFELLGGTAMLAMLKVMADPDLDYGMLLNSSKALQVIIAIFVSVAISFVVGMVVMWISRVVFTFNYGKHSRYSIAIFGGIAFTALSYFIFLKGVGKSPYLSDGVRDYIDTNTNMLLVLTFIVSTIVMEVLHLMKVNIFRFTVLMGTFALAMAFAGNDLVNFIGVPLAGLDSYQDYVANGHGVGIDGFMMSSLMESAKTPPFYLMAAGIIMIVAMATSKKAQNVIKTSVDLARQDEGDEMFGSSRAARAIVRFCQSMIEMVVAIFPVGLRKWINRRFNANDVELKDDKAAFDVVRAAVNLVIASMLITFGTNHRLPLSTTYVTFMVAMGTSLADRAWSRESAVFRITGVLTVIGGWFITAGVAFSACFFVGMAMQFGGIVAVVVLVVAAIWSIVHSQLRFARREKSEERDGDLLFRKMTTCHDRTAIPQMLSRHMDVSTAERLRTYSTLLSNMTDGLLNENLSPLRHTLRTLERSKRDLKNLRRRETICLRRMTPDVGVRLTTHFHLLHNALRQLHYGLLRMAEPAAEHVDNHYTPIDELHAERLASMRSRLCALIEQAAANLHAGRTSDNATVAENCREMQHELARMEHDVTRDIQATDLNLTAVTLLLHLVQEMQQLCVQLRLLLRASCHYHELMPTVASNPCHDEV